MAENRFIGNALARPKSMVIVGPTGVGVVSVEITCGARVFNFASWNASAVSAALIASLAPEFDDLTFTVSSNNILVDGPDDDDFIIGVRYRPLVTIENTPGADPVNQQTRIEFNGARSGTYKLTVNGQTTGDITYGDAADLAAELDALAGVSSSEFVIVRMLADEVAIEWTGVFATAAVGVVVDGRNLRNGRTLIVADRQQYSPGAHDVWLLGMGSSASATITIDSVAINIRSDHSLAEIRERLQSLSSRTLEVFGGPNGYSNSEGITQTHYVLNFVGWTAATRPAISLSSITGGGVSLAMVTDPNLAATQMTGAGSGWIALSPGNQFGLVRHILCDFTTGDEITLLYDGIEVTLNYEMTAVEIQAAIRDASEFNECHASETAVMKFSGSNFGWPESTTGPPLFTPGTAPFNFHNRLKHLLNPNQNIRQIGGKGTLRLLSYGGQNASAAIHAVYSPPGTTAGTFKLAFVEGVAGPFNYNASAATVETALDALIAAGVAVSGAGTTVSPWLITYATASGPRELPTATSVEFGGNGTASVSVQRERQLARTQKCVITIATNAVSGSFTVAFGSEGPALITLGDSAATVEAALALLPTIASGANIDVTYDSTLKQYTATFAGALANRRLPDFQLRLNSLDVIATTAVLILQTASGPRNFAEPDNWSLARVPAATDDIVIAGDVGDIRYGLRQWMAMAVNTTTERFTATGGHDFIDGQAVRFKATTGTGVLPTGLSASTTYYVIDANRIDGTFRVSAAANGSPVNISSTGTAPWFGGLLVNTLRQTASYDGSIGRSERTSAGYAEYLARYLQLGFVTTVDIGRGEGNQSGFARYNVGNSDGTFRVHDTASSDETNRRAVSILAASTVIYVELRSGELAIAGFEGESSVVGTIDQSGGDLYLGSVAAESFTKSGGRTTADSLTVGGIISMIG
jgi:hypothetical protein